MYKRQEEELVRAYKTCVRPVADYLDVVYHAALPDDLDEELDRLQNRALKIIFGAQHWGRTLRKLAGVTTLRERRALHCDKFAKSCAESGRFSSWFPQKDCRRSTRSCPGKIPEKYVEKFARCNRLRSSPLFFFRRRLNGKAGKLYGERYKEYREDS